MSETIIVTNQITEFVVADDSTEIVVIQNEVVQVVEAATQGMLGATGAQGIQGVQGVQGVQGEAGTGGDLSFVHSQDAAVTVWTITHNLNKYPSVTTIDSAKTTVYGSVNYLDANSLTITFNAAFGGKAILN